MDQSFIKNCTSELEIRSYKNFVVYRKDHSIFVTIPESSTLPSDINEKVSISSPLNANDIEKIENGVNKVLNKLNIEKTDTVELIVLSVVSFLVLIYILIFTANKRNNIARFLNGLSRHVSQRKTESTPDVSVINEEMEVAVENNNDQGIDSVQSTENFHTAEIVQHSANPFQSNITNDLSNNCRTINEITEIYQHSTNQLHGNLTHEISSVGRTINGATNQIHSNSGLDQQSSNQPHSGLANEISNVGRTTNVATNQVQSSFGLNQHSTNQYQTSMTGETPNNINETQCKNPEHSNVLRLYQNLTSQDHPQSILTSVNNSITNREHTGLPQRNITIESFNIGKTKRLQARDNEIIITRCPHELCDFTTQKGERGVNCHIRMMHKNNA